MAKVLGCIRRATKVITILELSKGAEIEDLLVALLGLCNLLMKEGKAMDAENPCIRIINIYSKLYGENDGRVFEWLCLLTHVKWNADEASQLYRNALQVLTDSKCMPLDENVMEKMIDLAELLHSVGRGKEDRELPEECFFATDPDPDPDPDH